MAAPLPRKWSTLAEHTPLGTTELVQAACFAADAYSVSAANLTWPARRLRSHAAQL